MQEKVLRKRIPANRRANTNDPGTPRSSPSPSLRRRIKPAAFRKSLEPSKDVNILKRSKSEPSLLKGVETTEAVEKDEGVLYRPETWADIFPSPEISTPRFPRKCYQRDAKVVVNVTVEGSAGPIQTLVKLGSNVEETINLVITKYNEEGRIPPLDKHSASTCQLHRSYFSLQKMARKRGGDEVKASTRRPYKAPSRCSAAVFRSAMAELLPIIGKRQLQWIKDSPFSEWLKMPKLSLSCLKVEAVLKRFDVESASFNFGNNICVPFTSSEFSIVMGLKNIGQPVNIDLEMDSDFLNCYFGGNISTVKRGRIREKLLELACKKKNRYVEDFARMFILFLFNCVVFPVGNYSTPRFIMPYLDDLDHFFDYSWGDAAYRFLYEQMAAHIGDGRGEGEGKKYVDGCLVGLMAWLYERVPLFAISFPATFRKFPRLFRWCKCKIPTEAVAAEDFFNSIIRTKVVPLVPFLEERALVEEMFVGGAVTSIMNEQVLKSHVGHLEKIVSEQSSEIQKLKRKCRSLDVARKSSKGKKHVEQTVECDLNDLHSVKVDAEVAKDEGTLKDAEDEVEDGLAKIVEQEAEKIEIANEIEKESEKVNVDSSMMHSKGDEDALDPNLNDQVSKMLVDESDAASGIDPSKLSNIRQRVERVRNRNKENLANAPRRTSRRLRETGSCLVGSTTEVDNIVDVDRIVEQVIEEVKYVLFPIGIRDHWFLLVWRSEKRDFVVMNSIGNAYDKASAKQYVVFLLGYLRNVKDCDLGKCDVTFPKCRDQGDTLDCGVFTCMWAECYVRDDAFVWNYQNECDIDMMRARIAASILNDEYGLLKMDLDE